MSTAFTQLETILSAAQPLDSEQAGQLVRFLADEQSSDAELISLTEAWRGRGYQAVELYRIAEYIREHYLEQVLLPPTEQVLDCCGTGGDRSGSFNISTSAAFVVASAGLKVAKHGGRRTTSQTGSMDFLEALGLCTSSEPPLIRSRLERDRLVFIASPALQKLLGRWKRICQQLHFYGQTGLIGTLTNPVALTDQVIGVPTPAWGPLMIEALRLLGRQRARVVYGEPGLDEVSVCGTTEVWQLCADQITHYQLNPPDYGLKLFALEELRGGTPPENARLFQDLLRGQAPEAIRQSVLLNAALILETSGQVSSLAAGLHTAETLLRDEVVREFYERIRAQQGLASEH